MEATERVKLTVSKEVDEMEEASESSSSSGSEEEDEGEEEDEAMKVDAAKDEEVKSATDPKPESKVKITNMYGIPDHILEQILLQRKDTRPSAQDLMRKAQASLTGVAMAARVLVPVNRAQHIQQQRMNLPIIRDEFQV